jgi:predicted nucleic acid-binding protein
VSLEFVDTNILIYAYDASQGVRHDRARELVDRLSVEARGAISVQVMQEFYVNAVRLGGTADGPPLALERLAALARWVVHAPLAGDPIAAARISQECQISFWDAMIVRSAEQLDCSVLWTEDLNAGQTINGVRIANPLV